MKDALEQLRALADGRGCSPEKEQHPDAELLHACAKYLDLFSVTPDLTYAEYRCRGDAADELFRELVRRATSCR